MRSGLGRGALELTKPGANVEAGNILAKQLSYFASADSAGIVMGARCRIALTSRADPVESRLASAALLALVCARRHELAAVTV